MLVMCFQIQRADKGQAALQHGRPEQPPLQAGGEAHARALHAAHGGAAAAQLMGGPGQPVVWLALLPPPPQPTNCNVKYNKTYKC